MACLLVPGAEAIVVKAVSKMVEKKEKAPAEVRLSFDGSTVETGHKISLSRKLNWLSNLQFGGALLLAFEHVWHGEITAFFPFLTAVSNPTSTAEMLHEMGTVGVGMAALTTAVWCGMLAVAHAMEKKASVKALPEAK